MCMVLKVAHLDVALSTVALINTSPHQGLITPLDDVSK